MTSCTYRHLSDSAGLMAAGRYNHRRLAGHPTPRWAAIAYLLGMRSSSLASVSTGVSPAVRVVPRPSARSPRTRKAVNLIVQRDLALTNREPVAELNAAGLRTYQLLGRPRWAA